MAASSPAYRARALAALVALAALAPGFGAAAPAPDNGAVVIMYHRFGESQYPSTNTTLEQLDRHIAELEKDKYTVMALPEIVAALAEGRALPERAVAITVDDAYASVYAEGWPRLQAAGLPFTLFVATDPLDRGLTSHLSWDELREMAASDLVTVGHHTASHLHMPEATADENRRDIARASEAFARELGRVPELFAFPYGEYGAEIVALVREAGFAAAFGQHSGAIARTAGRHQLPRFAMNEAYGGIERFRLAVNSLPLPVSDVTPADNVLAAAENPPLYGFTVAEAVAGDIGRLNCFASGRGRVEVERIAGARIEVRLDAPFPRGRARINCTMPGPQGRWRWFGNQFYVVGP